MSATCSVAASRTRFPFLLLAAFAAAGASACDSDGAPPLPREPWVDRPVAEWPDFDLSNDVVSTPDRSMT